MRERFRDGSAPAEGLTDSEIGNMSLSLKAALDEALEDEYRARATYRAVLEAFGDVRPFNRIVESEGRHIGALSRLYEKYGIRMPEDRWHGRVGAPDSLAEACRAGVEGEIENRALYDRLMREISDHPDVVATFERLRSASQERHLPAFERGLARAQGAGPSGQAAGPRRTRRRGRCGRES